MNRKTFYFKHYIGTSEGGFVKYCKEISDYSDFVKDLERRYFYGWLEKDGE